ncbi:unnamed protein product [Polarella glacialis]|uniref:Uncharacterized protein n=1 Tax=Polarella glacialis TaxID=89957 RepID=A0A813HL22_POLGL|nr:unnamed protein product [Polarella glacialis]CAE8690466.1 unnamed protein product [Polarella glacialis]
MAPPVVQGTGTKFRTSASTTRRKRASKRLRKQSFPPGLKPDSKANLSRSKSSAPDDGDRLEDLKDKFHDAKVVPEPPGLVNYDSYHLNPLRADVAEDHPIAPCAPTHRLHLKRLGTTLNNFQQCPVLFQDLVLFRREQFISKGKEDEELAQCWAEIHQQALAEAQASSPIDLPARLEDSRG